MVYQMNQFKKRKRLEMARKAAEEDGEEVEEGGGEAKGQGKPGALVRLNWSLKKKAGKEEKKGNMSQEVKAIEMYLQKDLAIDTKHITSQAKNLAGSDKKSILQIAKSADHFSNIGRTGGDWSGDGGRLGHVMETAAAGGREQLKKVLERNANLGGDMKAIGTGDRGSRASGKPRNSRTSKGSKAESEKGDDDE